MFQIQINFNQKLVSFIIIHNYNQEDKKEEGKICVSVTI